MKTDNQPHFYKIIKGEPRNRCEMITEAQVEFDLGKHLPITMVKLLIKQAKHKAIKRVGDLFFADLGYATYSCLCPPKGTSWDSQWTLKPEYRRAQ